MENPVVWIVGVIVLVLIILFVVCCSRYGGCERNINDATKMWSTDEKNKSKDVCKKNHSRRKTEETAADTETVVSAHSRSDPCKRTGGDESATGESASNLGTNGKARSTADGLPGRLSTDSAAATTVYGTQ